MPLTLEPASVVFPYAFTSRRKRWTRAECHDLVATGNLKEGKFELIGGDILPKMGQNEPHVFVCSLVADLLRGVFGTEYIRQAAPIFVDEENEPEPDVAVTVRTRRDYLAAGTPHAA